MPAFGGPLASQGVMPPDPPPPHHNPADQTPAPSFGISSSLEALANPPLGSKYRNVI